VQAAATLSAPLDITTAPGTDANYSYTITNGANGISTYNLSSLLTVEANIAGSSTTVSVPAVTLGASTAVQAFNIPAAAGDTVTVTVPRDTVADSSINGIANGDVVIVKVGLDTYVLTAGAVTDVQVPASPATGVANMTTTFALTLAATSTLPSGTVTVPVGTLLAERQGFTVSVTPGGMTSTVDATIDVTLTATDGTNAATDATQTLVQAVGLSVAKLVQNLTTASGTAGTEQTHCGITAYQSGVTANPGETLEYLIVVTKSASGNNATAVVVNDPIPPFTTLVAGSMQLDPDGDAGTALPFAVVTEAADGDAGREAGGTVSFYPGTGGDDAGTGTGGTLSASEKVCMKFRVTVQ